MCADALQSLSLIALGAAFGAVLVTALWTLRD